MVKKKEFYRNVYLRRRQQLSADLYHQLNGRLFAQFRKVDLKNVTFLHTFLPILKQKEPDTYPLIEYIRQQYPQIKLVVSKSGLEDNSLEHHLLCPEDPLAENRWGIPEPMRNNPVDVRLLDLIIVPLLVCDLYGNRIGYGKGYYDRFLRACRKDARCIGLGFFDPLKDPIEADLHDVALNGYVSPDGMYTFS